MLDSNLKRLEPYLGNVKFQVIHNGDSPTKLGIKIEERINNFQFFVDVLLN